MTFKKWVQKFIDEDSPMGDLARDIRGDKKFPQSSNEQYMLKYLNKMNACSDAINTFKFAFNRYCQEVPRL